MARYQTDFSEYPTGQHPSDWRGFPEDGDEDWLIEAGVGPEGGNNLTRDDENFYSIRWEEDAHGDLEALALHRFDTKTNPLAGLILRSTGTASGEIDQYLFYIWDDDTINIEKLVQGTFTWLADGATLSWSANQWIWIRARVEGTSLMAKAWAHGDPEPSSWQVTATDSDITGTGFAGCDYYGIDGVNTDYDVFAFATDGDTAVMAEDIDAEGDLDLPLPSISGTTLSETISSVDAGIVTVAGQEVGTFKSSLISVDNGSVLLAGQAVDWLRDTVSPVDAGAITLAGQQAEFLAGFVMEGGPGTLVLAGQEANFDILEFHEMSAVRGRIILRGNEAFTRHITKFVEYMWKRRRRRY